MQTRIQGVPCVTQKIIWNMRQIAKKMLLMHFETTNAEHGTWQVYKALELPVKWVAHHMDKLILGVSVYLI